MRTIKAGPAGGATRAATYSASADVIHRSSGASTRIT